MTSTPDVQRYRKKPIVVEASRWFRHGDHPAVLRLPMAHQADTHGWIDTLEGPMRVSPGDWIVTGVKGERYPVKPDIFEATYEPAE